MDNIADTLEQLVDTYGLYAVITVLAEVCDAKAAHLAVNWQDYPAERRWLRAARRIDACETALHRIQLP